MGHWYDTDGNTAYETIGNDGKLRPTTLRDARKLQLVPSVTTIMAVLSSPGLEVYKENQIVQACYEYPFADQKEEYLEWKKKIIMKSRDHAKRASERGTQIHDKLEQYFIHGGITSDDSEFIEPVVEFLYREFGDEDWAPERSFTHKLGFGGKMDLSSPNIILDFKTKDKDEAGFKSLKAYDNHHMQTAAYAVGLDIPQAKRYNLFISTSVPGLIKLTESTDFDREWAMFKCCLDIWQLQNKYKPNI